MTMYLVLTLALLALFAGVLSLTQATWGVGLIGVACFLAVLTRLAQAERQQKQLMAALAKMNWDAQEKR